jgi:NAD(P)-dependent dehydrogenase (short-subunit alcohol dehydrogenase family)
MKKNKTILITGAALRIGKAIALALAKSGYDLIVHYNGSYQEAVKVKALVQKYKVKCGLLQADLRKENAYERLIENAFSMTENLFGLINNAAHFVKKELTATSSEELLALFTVNCFAPILLTKAFASRLRKKNGVVINMLDCRIATSNCHSFAYTLSKKTLAEATKMMADEFAPKLKINAIAPGPVIAPDFKKTGIREMAGSIPLRNKPKIVDVIKGILFLLETDSITGETIFIDGGQHLCTT